MQEAVMLLEGNRRCERPGMSTEVERNLQSVIHRKERRCMKEGGRIMQLIWTVCVDETAEHIAGRERTREKNEILTRPPNIFPNHAIDVLADLLKEKLHDQCCAQSLSSIHLSVPRSEFVLDTLRV